jgi:hypothetical protein
MTTGYITPLKSRRAGSALNTSAGFDRDRGIERLLLASNTRRPMAAPIAAVQFLLGDRAKTDVLD